ncbi:MAG: Mpo1-like protein [Burkholderiaceae bacterium]
MNRTLALLIQYARYHRDPRNIATHYIGIPMIVFAVGALLARWRIDAGGLVISADAVAWALATLWYLRQGIHGVTLATATATGLLVALAHPLGQAPIAIWLSGGLGVFVIGWAFQFVGHAWEGRKPAFVDDIRGLLVGPMFVVAELWFVLGGGKDMEAAIVREAGPVARQTPRTT